MTSLLLLSQVWVALIRITLTSSLLCLIILTVSGKLSISSSIGNRHLPYLLLLHVLSLTVFLLLSLRTRFINSTFPYLPSPLSSLRTHLHHQLHLLSSLLSDLHPNQKYLSYFLTVQTNKLILILFPPGFLRNAHLFSFLLLPT